VQKGGLLHLINDSTKTLPVLAIDSTFTVNKVTRQMPGELRFGLCLKPVNIIPTQLFFEVVYQDWKNASTEYKFKSDADLSTVPVDFYESAIKYRDVVKFHCGIEHVFFSGVPFRLGFYHDPNPISADMDRNWFTAGTGYRFGNFNLEVSGAFTSNEYEYHDLFPITGEERVEFDTVRESYLIGMLTLRYDF
jgi:long-subunit fatty acid transport protein